MKSSLETQYASITEYAYLLQRFWAEFGYAKTLLEISVEDRNIAELSEHYLRDKDV